MRILVVGHGGREHALVRALANDGAEVFATLANPGMTRQARSIDVAPDDLPGLVEAAALLAPDLVVVGPEGPLVAGLADVLRSSGQAVLGPGADGARLEGSKAFAKTFLNRHGIPTARHATCATVAEALAVVHRWGAPLVVKADGLAAGKGVVVAQTIAEAELAVRALMVERRLGDAGATVVIEEWLQGPEVSLMALCDGRQFFAFDPCRDHKRLQDGDLGPMTGGMGALCPVPGVSAAQVADWHATVVTPTVTGLRRDGIDFRGVLYAGLILTREGPKVLEYNVRFGDPEAQALLPRLGPGLADLLLATARGELDRAPRVSSHGVAVTVVLSAEGYPTSPRTGDVIRGLEEVEARQDVVVHHAGTRALGREVVTAGGRVMSVTGLGSDLKYARSTAYQGADGVHFEGAHCRKDIGAA
ncbi:MAG: phosphoribosylamine--glycine ligase [Myxococcota bacterium]